LHVYIVRNIMGKCCKQTMVVVYWSCRLTKATCRCAGLLMPTSLSADVCAPGLTQQHVATCGAVGEHAGPCRPGWARQPPKVQSTLGTSCCLAASGHSSSCLGSLSVLQDPLQNALVFVRALPAGDGGLAAMCGKPAVVAEMQRLQAPMLSGEYTQRL
jgi:hypothetical protein